jgi:hypothetical protein
LGRIYPHQRISENMKDFISEIISRVSSEIQNQAETVTAGTNVNSFDDYKQYVGKIEGLKLTLAIINEILTEDEEES